jgi:hypothetical protein
MYEVARECYTDPLQRDKADEKNRKIQLPNYQPPTTNHQLPN